ncbi:PREDICTED: D-amino-acid oxidase-like [Branchiostoma belcheri]|uniref:D-amino-acid oxidase n=1 Tax=Branchiostoma belcheri TaxID=7741 RepID=A0A6P4ZIJ7_BRABE|nr:PREDICTED: D-amino-acid oxidase-like [Branchiostoma belcheri]XP_019636564.1 PREDICTED: D-amino-acid oxidase-like [Branchiostoma belcheri]
MKVVVLGAGIVGLTSALRIVEDCGTAELDLTVMADKFSPNTTSDVAAGIWCPPRRKMTQREMQWLKWSHEYLTVLLKTPYAHEIGVFLQSGWIAWMHTDFQDPDWKDLVQGYRHPTKWELTHLFPEYKDGFFCTTFMLESRLFLPWVTNRLRNKAVKFVERKVQSLDELSLDYDVIINCTGVGAHDLVGDTKVFPARGQVIRVKAPWVKHWMLLEGKHPYVPGIPYVVGGSTATLIGGIRQERRWDLRNDPRDTKTIWNGVTTAFPALKDAKVIEERTGLRPMREEIRLERQEKTDPVSGRTVQVIHNYGHGANGITWSHGCAKEVALMVKQLLQEKTIKSRL